MNMKAPFEVYSWNRRATVWRKKIGLQWERSERDGNHVRKYLMVPVSTFNGHTGTITYRIPVTLALISANVTKKII